MPALAEGEHLKGEVKGFCRGGDKSLLGTNPLAAHSYRSMEKNNMKRPIKAKGFRGPFCFLATRMAVLLHC